MKMNLFGPLGLDPWLLRSVEAQGYTAPYPIQAQAIPHILDGKDLLGIAETGSGKTASYLLPVIQHVFHANWEMANRHIPALIIVPTRELAEQVHRVFQSFTASCPHPLKSMAVYGGVSINPQMIGMQGVDVLIATPGRLLDLLDSKAMSLSQLKILVLDEADKLLNLGFKEEMDSLLKRMPAKRQNLLFSATLSSQVNDITSLILQNPVIIKNEAKEIPVELIRQRAFRVPDARKGPFLRYLIKTMDLHQVLVFTSTIRKADHVAQKLCKNGIEAKATHGKKSNKARADALSDFKAGDLRVLVSTDLLSRGIDIDFLPCVINYELPRSPKEYIHRIGRTGRAENSGQAFSLVDPSEQHHLKVIEKKMKHWMTLEGTEEVDLHGY